MASRMAAEPPWLDMMTVLFHAQHHDELTTLLRRPWILGFLHSGKIRRIPNRAVLVPNLLVSAVVPVVASRLGRQDRSKMGLPRPRGLRPAAGALLGLGAGFTVVSLSDADSEARRWVTAARGEILLTALRRRLHGEQEAVAAASPQGGQGVPAARPSSHRFYVVTGPDEHLTSLGRDRVLHMPAAVHCRWGDGHDGNSPRRRRRRIARLAVPSDCTLGTGQFSLLLEQQILLRPPDAEGDSYDGGPESSIEGDSPTEPGGTEVLQDHQEQKRSTWDNGPGIVESKEEGDPLPPPPAAPTLLPISTWESLVLRATRSVLDGKQLDHSAIWALEHALSGVRARSTPASSSSPLGDPESDGGGNQEAAPPAAEPAPSTADGGCAFVLEIWQPAPPQTRAGAGGGDGGGAELRELCGELTTWGWGLVSRGLGSVLVR